MKRFTVNLDDKTGEKLEAKAQADSRSLSSYVSVLIRRDLSAKGKRVKRRSHDISEATV